MPNILKYINTRYTLTPISNRFNIVNTFDMVLQWIYTQNSIDRRQDPETVWVVLFVLSRVWNVIGTWPNQLPMAEQDAIWRIVSCLYRAIDISYAANGDGLTLYSLRSNHSVMRLLGLDNGPSFR
eukprot:143676_1